MSHGTHKFVCLRACEYVSTYLGSDIIFTPFLNVSKYTMTSLEKLHKETAKCGVYKEAPFSDWQSTLQTRFTIITTYKILLYKMEYHKLQQLKKEDKFSDKADVALKLCPDGSQLSININGTTLNATKTSFSATIGNFSISVNGCDLSTLHPPQDLPLPPTLVVSISEGNPLHVISGDADPPYVTANIETG